ncbi:MAG: shikimate dehydrogenase [Clostridiales Family XIII bacterium]|jgi:shikimate 5-dehydrogenase|nr:shikimate dehydrogenase [Clostridiales Family XIII bacterium]
MAKMFEWKPAEKNTIYFIGVTTGNSSIMNVFPKWAEELDLQDTQIIGIDLPLHAPNEDYRKVCNFLKKDKLSLGALVTTHKLDLFEAAEDIFDEIDEYAKLLKEVSSISKKDGKFIAHAKDPISSGLALEKFLPSNFFTDHRGEVLIFGAGGSSLAMSVYFGSEKRKSDIPKTITIANRSVKRLESAEKTLKNLEKKIKMRYVHNPEFKDNDKTLEKLPPYSLIINATGLGKDAPGSPITDNAIFPENSLVWEINYRGDLLFRDQAERQKNIRKLHIEDGWTYFIHGWTQVISEVFHIPIEGEILDQLSKIARK